MFNEKIFVTEAHMASAFSSEVEELTQLGLPRQKLF